MSRLFLAEVRPRPGEEKAVMVSGPFLADGTGPFWALFEPALAAVEGFDEYPELLHQGAMVACTTREILAQAGGYAWLNVRVEDVVGVAEAPRRFPPSAAGSVEFLLPPDGSRATVQQAASGGLRYYSWSVEGDIGCWAVCTEDRQSIALVLYGEWAFEQNDVALGHRPLSLSETAALEAAYG